MNVNAHSKSNAKEGVNMYREYHFQPEDCPNCGKPNSAIMGSTSWGHDYLCCSEACGKRLGQKIDSGMIDIPRYRFSPFAISDNDSVKNLRFRIKELENQLKQNGIKPKRTTRVY